MILRRTDPESYITEYTLVYEDNARQDMGTAERDLSTHVMWEIDMGTDRVRSSISTRGVSAGRHQVVGNRVQNLRV